MFKMKLTRAGARNDSGQVMLMTTLMLPVLIGVVALAVDVGYLFDYRRQAQTAADAGANAAGLKLYGSASATLTELETAARADTALNGFTHGSNSITVTVNNPPVNGYYAGVTGYVEVVVSRPTPMYLARALGWTSMTVAASAVAGPGNSRGCIYVLTTESGKGLWVTGTARITAANCEVYSNSDMFVDSGACVTAQTINITRNRTGSGCYTATVNANTNVVVTDPLAHLGFPTTCESASVDLKITSAADVTALAAMTGGNYCYKKIEVEYLGGPVTFPAGNWHGREGIFLKNGTTTLGTGVTFFTHTDKWELAGDATLSAPTTGAYAGILVYVKRNNDKDIEVKNDSEANLEGTLYTRDGKILYSGTSSGTSSYTVLVAKEMSYSGTGTMNNNYSSLPGGSPVKKPGIAD